MENVKMNRYKWRNSELKTEYALNTQQVQPYKSGMRTELTFPEPQLLGACPFSPTDVP